MWIHKNTYIWACWWVNYDTPFLQRTWKQTWTSTCKNNRWECCMCKYFYLLHYLLTLPCIIVSQKPPSCSIMTLLITARLILDERPNEATSIARCGGAIKKVQNDSCFLFFDGLVTSPRLKMHCWRSLCKNIL